MSILNEIIAHKKKELAEKKELVPIKRLSKQLYFDGPCLSLKNYLLKPNQNGIIAEIKRKSPSKGFIKKYADVKAIATSYMQAGATALSVLTDEKYFGGTLADLEEVRKFNFCPVLRKDFIIEEYQLFEAKAYGADVVLLIASALSPAACKMLAQQAKQLGLETLLEVHNQEEIELYLNEHIDLVGVNNRSLHSFDISLENSYDLIEGIPADFTAISESGIQSIEEIESLRKVGFKGFLMGSRFMQEQDPGKSLYELLNSQQYVA